MLFNCEYFRKYLLGAPVEKFTYSQLTRRHYSKAIKRPLF